MYNMCDVHVCVCIYICVAAPVRVCICNYATRCISGFVRLNDKNTHCIGTVSDLISVPYEFEG